MSKLIEIGSKATEKAIALGSDQAEAFLTKTRAIGVGLEKGSIKTAGYAIDVGVGIRAFYKGSLGMSYATTLNLKAVLDTVRKAVKQARAGTPDPDFKSLPEPKPLPRVTGIHDPKVARIDATDMVNMTIEAAEIAKIDKRIYSININVGAGHQKVAIVNSLGVAYEDEGTLVKISAGVTAKEGNEMTYGFEEQSSRHLQEIDPIWVGKTAAEYAIKSLNPQKIRTATLPIVVDPIAAGYLFTGALGTPLNADFVQRGRSYLSGRLGEEIGCKQLTITDNGILPRGLSSLAFDAEGTPSQKTILMDKGVLKSYEYDSYTAGKEGRESTGNCVRLSASAGFWDYRERPFISIRNLVVNKGHGMVYDLISEVREGIWLRTTYDLPNIATGEFSGLMAEAYKIENGEVTYPIKQATLGINMIDGLRRIDAIGADSKKLIVSSVDMIPRSIETPSIRISQARVASSR